MQKIGMGTVRMSYLLEEPTTVLVVGTEAGTGDVRAEVAQGRATDIVEVARLEATLEVLADRQDIGCVVVYEPEDASHHEAYRAIRADHRELPIVVYAAEDVPDYDALVGELDCQFLPASTPIEELCTTVDDALSTFEQRRETVAKSQMFQALLDQSNTLFFAKDEAGQWVYSADVDGNQDPEDIRGKRKIDVDLPGVSEAECRSDFEDDMHVIETGEPIYRKPVHYDSMSPGTWEEHTKLPWRIDGEIVGLVGFFRDVTRRKLQKHRLQQQSERIDQFIRHVAHNVRTPLQVAYGSLDRARDGDEAAIETARERLERVESMIQDLQTLSADEGVSEFSSTSIKLLRADSVTTQFVPFVEGVWSVVGIDAAELVVDLPEETSVGADAEILQPMVFHLLQNAVEHAGPDVTVRIGEAGDDGFFVADDGPGLPEERRATLAEDGLSASDEAPGLVQIAETVEQQGWDLTVEESRASGARFEITGVPMVTERGPERATARRIDLEASEDIGPVSIAGDAVYDADADRWTITANGANVWRHTHEFHLVHGSGTAPVRIEGRIENLDGVDGFSKVGLTVRAGTDERDPFGYVGVTDAHGSEVTWRPGADDPTNSYQFEELPGMFEWYRVEYVDGVVTCCVSTDGDGWVPIDQRAIDLGDRVTVGISVCSHSDKRTCEAILTDVRAWELENSD